MSHRADAIALSPFAAGESFFAGLAAVQRQIADNMLALFDAVADAASESVRATEEFAHGIADAQTPADAVVVGFAWFRGRVEEGVSWFRSLAERMAPRSPVAASPAEGPDIVPAVTKPIRRAPIVPQEDIRMPTKPLAGKLRRPATAIVTRVPKKPARPGAK